MRDYGEVGERARLFTVQVRCRACEQVVPAVPERSGLRMWQHKLASGEDCPAWKLGTDHEPVDAQERRARLARERDARSPIAMGPAHGYALPPPDPDVARALDEYSGDYRDRRAGGSRS
jgi:hypothetical protein